MVDVERLLSLLGRVTARLAILDEYAVADRATLLADPVHGYAEVDDGLVIDHLADLPSLRRFVATMTTLL